MTQEQSQSIHLLKLTRCEFRNRMESGELKACIIPVGATEQHLEHLAFEQDWSSVNVVADAVAENLSPSVLVAPSMNIGVSEHHTNHIGTLSASPGNFIGILWDTVRSMQRSGFENILILNGHGGNIAPVEGSWNQFLLRFGINLHFSSYWEFISKEFAQQHLKTKSWPGHAQEFETAFALAAFPENVRHDAMQDQKDRTPLEATAETGQILIDEIVNETTAFVSRMISGEVKADVPPFFP